MFLVFLFFITLDRLLKHFFLKNPAGLVKNPGSFLFSSFIILVLALFVFKFKKRFSPLFLFAVMLILLGGLSNFYDRIFLGFVVDYIKISLFPFVFNFSDIMITVGCVLVIYSLPRKAGFKSPAS